MKKFAIILALISISFAVRAQVEKVKIKTSAVCGMCKNTIEHDLAFEKGIKTAQLDVDTKILTVEYNPKKTDVDKIRTRVTKIGYNADSKKRDPKSCYRWCSKPHLNTCITHHRFGITHRVFTKVEYTGCQHRVSMAFQYPLHQMI